MCQLNEKIRKSYKGFQCFRTCHSFYRPVYSICFSFAYNARIYRSIFRHYVWNILFFWYWLNSVANYITKKAVLGVMRGKKTDEPYKSHVEYADFDELKDTIVAQLKRKKYKLYELDNEYLRDKLFIYHKNIWFDQKFFIIAYPGSMDDEEFLTEVSCTVSSILREVSPFSRSHLYVTSMHCVNTESDAFFSRLKEVYVFNPICEYEIRAGYAIDSQTLYIGAPYFGDLGIGPVIILRRKLLKILGIPRKKLKK